jgi:hypothetical protein
MRFGICPNNENTIFWGKIHIPQVTREFCSRTSVVATVPGQSPNGDVCGFPCFVEGGQNSPPVFLAIFGVPMRKTLPRRAKN